MAGRKKLENLQIEGKHLISSGAHVLYKKGEDPSLHRNHISCQTANFCEEPYLTNLVVEEVTSDTDIIRREVTDVQVDAAAIVAPESEAMLPSDLAVCESQQVVENAYDGDMVGITVMEDIVRER